MVNGDPANDRLKRKGPAINDVMPVFYRESTFDNTYNDLNLPIDLNGCILVASDFVQGLYVHMGFHSAWIYQNVFELIVSHGSVIERCRRSGTKWSKLPWNRASMPRKNKSKNGSLRPSSLTTILNDHRLRAQPQAD
jgi:hypothetical protein